MKKQLFAFCTVGLLCIRLSAPVQAAEISITDKSYSASETTDTEIMPLAEGLIINYTLSCSSATKAIKITSKTLTSSSMAKIGFKDIVIQRSSDKVNWADNINVGDMLKSSASIYSLSNYPVSVDGGYYYRVKLTHYAKESGLLGSSQSISNTSNSVWIN